MKVKVVDLPEKYQTEIHNFTEQQEIRTSIRDVFVTVHEFITFIDWGAIFDEVKTLLEIEQAVQKNKENKKTNNGSINIISMAIEIGDCIHDKEGHDWEFLGFWVKRNINFAAFKKCPEEDKPEIKREIFKASSLQELEDKFGIILI